MSIRKYLKSNLPYLSACILISIPSQALAKGSFNQLHKSIHKGQSATYIIIAKDGEKFTKKSEINIIAQQKGMDFIIESQVKGLYKYDKGKKRLVIGDNDVSQIILSISYDKKQTATASTVDVHHIYNNDLYGSLTFNLSEKSPEKTETIVAKAPDDTKTIENRDKPAIYTLTPKDKDTKIKKNDVFKISIPIDAPKVIIEPEDSNVATFNASTNTLKVDKDVDSLKVQVKQHPDTHLLKDVLIPINHEYIPVTDESAKFTLKPLEIKQKGNSIGMACSNLSLSALYELNGGACFNVHTGALISFDENANFSPKPYALLVSRHIIRKKAPNCADGSTEEKCQEKWYWPIENIGETYFEADLYDIPALIAPDKSTEIVTNEDGSVTTVTTETSRDSNQFITDNTIFRLATGFKVQLTDTTNINFRLEGKHLPSSSHSIHSLPLSYELGFERAVSFGEDSDSRGMAGISYAKDEFWQYHTSETIGTGDDEEQRLIYQDYKKRFKLYGSLALNETRTLLLHGFINTNTKGNGPGLAGIRLTYGGNWENLAKSLMGSD